MADNTTIEWTDATWNVVNGCSPQDRGCDHCYAARMAATRLKNHPSRAGLTKQNAAGDFQFNGKVYFNEKVLFDPLRWRKPRMIFVCAHGDLFHESVPDEWIDRLFAVMALCPQHVFQVLTRRPERMREYLSQRDERGRPTYWANAATWAATGSWKTPKLSASTWPLPNVWLGTSVIDQATADKRIPQLLDCPAAIRFVSYEPALGPVDFEHIGNALFDRKAAIRRAMTTGGLNWDQADASIAYPELDWIIAGGESGPNARPAHPDWFRSVRDQCQAAGTAFFFKQWGEWLPWDRDFPPLWASQNGQLEDNHTLFPSDFDNDPKWDDGLGYVAENYRHCVFQKVGKKAAGRLLDGVEWNQMPSLQNEVTQWHL